jgi:hypothetical protein
MANINAASVIRRVHDLHDAGWTNAQIARATSLDESVIRHTARGICRTVRPATARGILSVSVGPPPASTFIVDATGTMRRIQALTAMGHSSSQLAQDVGTHRSVLGRIARGEHPTVRKDTAAAVAREYRRLSRIPGGNYRARAEARRKGWLSPIAWDDIDNPSAKPETGRGDRATNGASRRQRAAA